MATRIFTTDELEQLDIPKFQTSPDFVLDEIIEVDEGRELHRHIFRLDGTAWEIYYRAGTERIWFDDDDVEATAMEQRPAVRLEWRDADTEPDRSVLDPAVRALVNEIDYDVHKRYECNEETGEDTYPELVATFEDILRAILAPASEPQD